MILIKPIITERSLRYASLGRFTFEVEVSANKPEIAAEVAKTFNVHPVSVRTMVLKGGLKRSMRTRKYVQKADRKKAVITLKAGEKIDLFETGGTNA